MRQKKDNRKPEIFRGIDDARRTIVTSRLLLGGLLWLSVLLGLWLILCLLDNLLHLPAGIRLAFALSGLALIVFLFLRQILLPLLHRPSHENVVLNLEKQFNFSENILINAYQFEARTAGSGAVALRDEERPFADRTIRAGSLKLAAIPLKTLRRPRYLFHWLIGAGLCLLIWAVYALAASDRLTNAFSRFLMPMADIPPAGSVRIEITPDRDIMLNEGENLIVNVTIHHLTGSDELARYPVLVWQDGAAFLPAEASLRPSGSPTMKQATLSPQSSSSAATEYHHTFPALKRSLAFRVFAADTWSRSIPVKVISAPRLVESRFDVTPPAYTGSAKISQKGPPRSLSVPPGSEIQVQLKLDKPADELTWTAFEQSESFQPHRDAWSHTFTADRTGRYQVHVRGQEMHSRLLLTQGGLSLLHDTPPEVSIQSDQRTLSVFPGQRLRLPVLAADDYGIRDIVAASQPAGNHDSRAPTRHEHWNYPGPPGRRPQVEERLLLSIDPALFRPGHRYILTAAARDFAPADHLTTSDPLLLDVKSLAEITIPSDDPARSAFAELDKAIAAQQAALGAAGNILSNFDELIPPDAEPTTIRRRLDKQVSTLRSSQLQVAVHLSAAWNLAPDPRPDFVDKMKHILDHEQVRVTRDINTLKKNTAPTRPAARNELTSIRRQQQYILDRLIALKGTYAHYRRQLAEKAAAELLGEAETFESFNTTENLETLQTEIEDFLDSQKDIMHHRNMLSDLPPEDFSDENEQVLRQLAIDQSKLAEILAHAVTDLSNQNLLDFGDNAMVDQMTAIYEKADDLADTALDAAAQRQARADAHRLETEAVEMAEEILINCEATLGFHDNIQFIAEIPEDEQLFAPLAELPSELEDLVGDLITSEEEMRDEVEDIGSYLNSLDHTAGPVADGTISSTSAKGKTGDQKPEDNIIQGRSGAGRSGMSDGQLVESVAKDLEQNEYGLRERVSNTPLESGSVKDEDLGAQTGGTGLGKQSDKTTRFGVGNQLPDTVLDRMQATLRRQQSIRQAAQQAIPRLQRYNLDTDELKTSVYAMQDVEQAIRRRDGLGIRQAYQQSLDALHQSRQRIFGQIQIQYRRRETVARDLDLTQTGSARRNLEGYQHIVNAYFEALTEKHTASD